MSFASRPIQLLCRLAAKPTMTAVAHNHYAVVTRFPHVVAFSSTKLHKVDDTIYYQSYQDEYDNEIGYYPDKSDFAELEKTPKDQGDNFLDDARAIEADDERAFLKKAERKVAPGGATLLDDLKNVECEEELALQHARAIAEKVYKVGETAAKVQQTTMTQDELAAKSFSDAFDESDVIEKAKNGV